MNKTLLAAAAALMLFAPLTSCSTDDDNTEVLYTYDFTYGSEFYNADGYWTQVFADGTNNFVVPPYTIFSHRVITNADGTKAFTGFCPSRVSDTGNYPGQWDTHQWAAMAPTHSAGYVVANWQPSETEATTLNDRSCAIGFSTVVQPVSITVANTTRGFYGMADFTAQDRCQLVLHGVGPDNRTTGTVAIDLATAGSVLDKWKTVDITGLGNVNAIYFTVVSTADFNPATFAIGSMQVYYSSDAL